MSFKLTIENFGKLAKAEIRIGPFTVFSGPNNTGKSFVSKLLYSLFDVMNADHARMYFNMLSYPVRNGLLDMRASRFAKENEEYLANMDSLVDLIETFFEPDYSRNLEENWPNISNYARELKKKHVQLERNLDKWAREEDAFVSSKIHKQTLEKMKDDIGRLCGALENNAREFTMDGIKERISQNLVRNFQTANLSNLRKDQTRPARIVLDNVGIFTIENTKSVDFSIGEEASFHRLQEYSRVIYLESPLYWKLKSALEGIRMAPRFIYSGGKDALSGVPGYFYDLARALRAEYTDDGRHKGFMDLYKRLISEEVMDGKLAVSDTGDLRFEDNKHVLPLSLHLAAMGVVNIGILALLIERRVIDKGSFLFIDEPEAHLHPSWHVKIAKTLLGLSRLGVNVVIATHSVDILKFLEVAAKDPGNKELIALNRFSSEGTEDCEQSFDSKLDAIQENLTEPFTTLFLEDL